MTRQEIKNNQIKKIREILDSTLIPGLNQDADYYSKLLTKRKSKELVENIDRVAVLIEIRLNYLKSLKKLIESFNISFGDEIIWEDLNIESFYETVN